MKNLKKKVFQPVYFLSGEEPYYIDLISNYIEHHVLDEAEKGFNQSIHYGNETTVSQIIENSKRYPMMSEHQVVIVKEAQNVRDIESLESYIANPLKSTILVICYKYKTLDKRKTFAKNLSKAGYLFNSEKIKDWKLSDWIGEYVRHKGYHINPKNTLLLGEYLGNDLSKIANELGKAFINIEKGKEITAELIEKYIGVSKEYNNFELNNALAVKNVEKANRIIYHFGKDPKDHPFVVTLAMLYNFFSKILCYHYSPDKSQNNIASVLKIHPFIVKEYQLAASNYSARKALHIIELLREYDMKSKGVENNSTSDSELMKELVYKIMH